LEPEQVDQCLLEVNGRWLVQAPKYVRDRELRHLTFTFARECALVQVRERLDAERAFVAKRLSEAPVRGSRSIGKSRAQASLLAVRAISARCYEVFELYKRQGLTQPQIAARLSISEEDVLKELAAAVSAFAQAEFGEAPRARSLSDLAGELLETNEPVTGLRFVLN
jgi:DNA-binding CsgD family transcriptional regulator